MEYKIIANPVAGKGKAIALIDQVRLMLQERKAEFDFELTKAPGHAADIARSAAERGWEVVVSLGGDGTISEVISGLVGTESTLGIISCGRGNDIARSLGCRFRVRDIESDRSPVAARPRPVMKSRPLVADAPIHRSGPVIQIAQLDDG